MSKPFFLFNFFLSLLNFVKSYNLKCYSLLNGVKHHLTGINELKKYYDDISTKSWTYSILFWPKNRHFTLSLLNFSK